jgi:hypothetical protein
MVAESTAAVAEKAEAWAAATNSVADVESKWMSPCRHHSHATTATSHATNKIP